MLRESIRYPFGGDDAAETLIVGGGLHVATAFVPLVPLVFVLGYLVRVLDEASSGGSAALRDGTPPTFDDLRGLTADGVKATLVVGLYSAGPLAVLLVTVGGASGLSAGALTGTASLGVLVGSTAALFAALGVAYLLPAALVGYAQSRRFRAAFDRSTLRAATDARYFVAVVAAGGLLSAAAVVVSMGAPRTLPRFVGFFVLFYAEVAAAALVGHVCGESVPTERPERSGSA
ncbi:DUF4013 domain-containing protein [Haloprofundus halobius]|uniref:DUF4013 domain-containing protein n=1 Tax=Haloprofundus halobius TaxID=2876194 RepID=UPI001CCA5E14|nr:DUF4013 domain-containing protein [Haloprofundus halobius]